MTWRYFLATATMGFLIGLFGSFIGAPLVLTLVVAGLAGGIFGYLT